MNTAIKSNLNLNHFIIIISESFGTIFVVRWLIGHIINLIMELSQKKEFENDQRFKNFNAVKKCFKYIDEAVQVSVLAINIQFWTCKLWVSLTEEPVKGFIVSRLKRDLLPQVSSFSEIFTFYVTFQTRNLYFSQLRDLKSNKQRTQIPTASDLLTVGCDRVGKVFLSKKILKVLFLLQFLTLKISKSQFAGKGGNEILFAEKSLGSWWSIWHKLFENHNDELQAFYRSSRLSRSILRLKIIFFDYQIINLQFFEKVKIEIFLRSMGRSSWETAWLVSDFLRRWKNSK